MTPSFLPSEVPCFPRRRFPAHAVSLLLSVLQGTIRSGRTGHKEEGNAAAEGTADLQREAAARRRRGSAAARQGSRAAEGSTKDRLQQMFLWSDSEEEQDDVDADEEGHRNGNGVPGGPAAVSMAASPVSAVPLQHSAASPGVMELSFDSEVAESPVAIRAVFAEPGGLGGQSTAKRRGSSLQPLSPALGPTDATVLALSEEKDESSMSGRGRPRSRSPSPGLPAPHYLQSPLQRSPGTGAREASGPSGLSVAAAAAAGASPGSARRALEAELEAELEDTGEEEPEAAAGGLGRGGTAEESRDDVEEVEAMVATLREGLKGVPAQEGGREGEGRDTLSREPSLMASELAASRASAAAIASLASVKPRWPPAETPGSLSTMSRDDVADTCYHGSSENSDDNLSAWSDAPTTAHHSRGASLASAGGALSAGGEGGAALTFPQLPEGPSSPGAGLWPGGSGEPSPAMRGAAENPLFQAEASHIVSAAAIENPLFNPDEPPVAAQQAPGAVPFVSTTHLPMPSPIALSASSCVAVKPRTFVVGRRSFALLHDMSTGSRLIAWVARGERIGERRHRHCFACLRQEE